MSHTDWAIGDQAQVDRWVAPTLAGRLIGALGITEPDASSDGTVEFLDQLAARRLGLTA